MNRLVPLAATATLVCSGSNGAFKLLMQEVHGCHYTCECATPRDFGCEQQYHRHLHMLCLPVRCDRGTECERTPPVGSCRHIAPQ